MALSLDQSIATLAVLSEATRMLHEARPFGARIHDLFNLLHRTFAYHDARLTCWIGSARPGATRQQFYSADGWPYSWDDTLMRQVARQDQIAFHQLMANGRATGTGQLPAVPIVYLGVPIFWGGRLWGMLELRASQGTLFADELYGLMAALAPQLAAAIMAESKQQWPADSESTALAAVQQQLALFDDDLQNTLALPHVLSLLLRRAIELSGAESGAVSLIDHERGELILQVSEGYPPELSSLDLQHGQRQRWSWEIGLSGQAARSGRALLVRDVTQEPSLRLTNSSVRAELAAPIIVDGQALAIITLDSPRSAAFGDDELSFIQALCQRSARPLQRAMHYQEMLETSTHLSQVFGSLPTGLALMDTGSRIVRSNPAWASLWGLDPEELQRTFYVAIDLVDALLSRLIEPMQLTEFCANGQRSPAEVQITTVRLSNPTQELHVLSVPTRDSQDQITGRLWAVNDVTREREVDRLKNEFVSIVSHELRTPLTSILGYTELLLARDFPAEERKQFVKTVYDEASRLALLVEDLLGMSRLEAGKVQLNRWVIALRQIIAELTNQLNTQLARHRLVIRIEDPLPPVYIDRDRTKQILFNLLTNAIKYSPRGGEIELVISEVHLRQLPADHPRGRWVLVGVRDQGIGIAAEDLPRIWERFYRVDNGNTRRIGGTGLGLSITKALVELHGGMIWVESKIGEGSNFYFTLPVATEMARRG
ncbi:GAF domain-containing protein [Candidatus Gracilibacteria bacterium]|nr:GAF domain-containing protein [Candidatus Gracilibacteria bacterium]